MRSLRTFHTKAGRKFSNGSVAFRPAMPSSGRWPPGWLSLNLVRSQHLPSIATHRSAAELCSASFVISGTFFDEAAVSATSTVFPLYSMYRSPAARGLMSSFPPLPSPFPLPPDNDCRREIISTAAKWLTAIADSDGCID